MNTKEILTIVALSALGLCLLCSLAKAAMKKGDKSKKHCDKACGAFVFLAIVLMAVSQLLGEENEKYDTETKKLTKVYCDPAAQSGDPNHDHPCYYEKTLTDCLNNSGCTKEEGKRATGGVKPRGYNTQECKVCPNGQLLCGPCPP
jgi:hypothetical protein